MYQLITMIVFVRIFETTGQVLWNDPSTIDKHCIYPEAINFPQHIVIGLKATSKGYKLYAPMANKAYYRWMYHKAKNHPAATQADIDSLKPRIIFPDVTGIGSISQGTVEIFNPPTASYKLLCFPHNFALSNATCLVKNASKGSAPYGFGTGKLVLTTVIWADSTAFAEWHCFEGDRQVFNVISLNSSLTKHQIHEISNVVKSLGFSTSNFAYQVYN